MKKFLTKTVLAMIFIHNVELLQASDNTFHNQQCIVAMIGLQQHIHEESQLDSIPEVETEFCITYDNNAICETSRNKSALMCCEKIMKVRCKRNGEFSYINKDGIFTQTYMSYEDAKKSEVSKTTASTENFRNIYSGENTYISIERKYNRIKRTFYDKLTHKIHWDELDPTLNLNDPSTLALLNTEPLDPRFIKNK